VQPTLPRPAPPPELADSPLYLIAVLYSSRRSKDRALESVTRRRLDALGVRIVFADELPPHPATTEGGAV